MERDVYEAMKAIKAECDGYCAEWGGKCPAEQGEIYVCPLEFEGKCFFKGNKPHTWSIKSRVKGEKEWHDDV